jgi:hypothetical protein
MADFLKHVGMLRNTGKHVAVVFHRMPGRNDNALVCDMEALPPRYHDAVESLLRGKEAQASECKNFYDILSRRIMPDDGIPMLNVLHNRGYLTATPIDNVLMVPRPNMSIPLRQLLETLESSGSSYAIDVNAPNAPQNTSALVDPSVRDALVEDPSLLDAVKAAASQVEAANARAPGMEKFNALTHNQGIDKVDQQMQLARSYLVQAQLLEEDARKLRAKAQALAPVVQDETVKADINSIPQLPKRTRGRPRKSPMPGAASFSPATGGTGGNQ